MLIRELAEMVAEMRAKQRLYFMGRSPEVLRECKLVEKRVDVALKSVLSGDHLQPPLFPEGEE